MADYRELTDRVLKRLPERVREHSGDSVLPDKLSSLGFRTSVIGLLVEAIMSVVVEELDKREHRRASGR